MKLPAIKAVLGQYRSTDGVVTQEMITAAWAELAEVEKQLSRPVCEHVWYTNIGSQDTHCIRCGTRAPEEE